MMIGGRHLGAPSASPATIVVTLDDRPLLTFDVTPGFFLRFEPVAAGLLAGEGTFAKLAVTASSAGAVPPVAIEQFDIQPPDAPELGFDTGWHEPEYNPATGRSWRWMSERGTMAVRGGRGDLTLTITGEATRRYFPRASRFTVTVRGQALASSDIGQDFDSRCACRATCLPRLTAGCPSKRIRCSFLAIGKVPRTAVILPFGYTL